MSATIASKSSDTDKFSKGVRRRAVFTIHTPAPDLTQRPRSRPKNRYRSIHIPFLFSFFVLLAVSVGVSGYRLYRYLSKNTAPIVKQQAAPVLQDLDTKEIVKRVRKHMVLPDEEPVVQSVIDADKVRQEPFYARAKNGDKVLVFRKRAILYNPTQDKIIEVGSIQSPVTAVEKPLEGPQQVAGVATSSARILFQNDKK